MTKLTGALFAATLSLLFAALLAAAQATPKTPAKPSTPPPAAAAPEATKGEKCACPGCAAGKSAAHGSGSGNHGDMQGMMMNCPMHANHECPFSQVAAIADVKVETTKLGASLQLVAKNPSDVEKVRQLARETASHLSAQPHHAH